jgi:DNA replication protein DnaC
VEALLAAELQIVSGVPSSVASKRRICRASKRWMSSTSAKAPSVSPTYLSELAEGGYIERAEPVVFIGDSGTGKTHLLTALCVAVCRQRRRVRCTTAAALVNELVEAKQQLQLRRVLAGWARYDVIAIDEVSHVPLAALDAGAVVDQVPNKIQGISAAALRSNRT